eukprot:7004321-Prymnesium_polylepis.2
MKHEAPGNVVVLGAHRRSDATAVEAGGDDIDRLDVPTLKARRTVAMVVRRVLVPLHGEGREATAIAPRVVRRTLTPQLLAAVRTPERGTAAE